MASSFSCLNYLLELVNMILLNHQNSSILGRLMSKNSASNTGTHAGLLLNFDWHLMPSGKRHALTSTANYPIPAVARGALHLWTL